MWKVKLRLQRRSAKKKLSCHRQITVLLILRPQHIALTDDDEGPGYFHLTSFLPRVCRVRARGICLFSFAGGLK